MQARNRAYILYHYLTEKARCLWEKIKFAKKRQKITIFKGSEGVSGELLQEFPLTYLALVLTYFALVLTYLALVLTYLALALT